MKKFVSFIAIAVFLIFSAGCGGNKSKAPKPVMNRITYYQETRKILLNVTPQQLGIESPGQQNKLYGIVIEQNVAGLISVMYAAYYGGEAADIVQTGRYLINTGLSGTSGGVSKLLYDNAARYLDFYKDDIKKYLQNAGPHEASSVMLSTLFIDGNENPGTMDLVQKYIASISEKYPLKGLKPDKEALPPAANKIAIHFLTYGGRFFVEDDVSAINKTDYAAILSQRVPIANEIAQNADRVETELSQDTTK